MYIYERIVSTGLECIYERIVSTGLECIYERIVSTGLECVEFLLPCHHMFVNMEAVAPFSCG